MGRARGIRAFYRVRIYFYRDRLPGAGLSIAVLCTLDFDSEISFPIELAPGNARVARNALGGGGCVDVSA